MRVGLGYDSHRLIENETIVLGGVTIPFEKGLEGWSDADVVIHAIMDALCGASRLGDIGILFPPGDERYHAASSLSLLQNVTGMITSQGLRISNVDATIVAEVPLLSPYLPQMCRNLGAAMRIEDERVSVKAKTNEHMGFVGRGEGIAAFAVVLLEP